MNRISSTVLTALLIVPVGLALTGCGPGNTPAATGAVGSVTAVGSITAPASTKSINVHGVGTASETPDKATLTIGIETDAPTAQVAMRDNNTKATELIKLLKVNGVADKNVQTSQLSVNPRYDEKGTKIVGYQVSNLVTVTVTELAKVGPVIDAAAGAAGDSLRLQNLSFGLSDDSAAMKAARIKAVENAKAQAEQLATAAGVKVGALRIINSSSIVNAPVLYQFERGKVADAGVPIAPGSADVTAEVDLVFELVA